MYSLCFSVAEEEGEEEAERSANEETSPVKE